MSRVRPLSLEQAQQARQAFLTQHPDLLVVWPTSTEPSSTSESSNADRARAYCNGNRPVTWAVDELDTGLGIDL